MSARQVAGESIGAGTIVISVPLTIRRRGGRKLVLAPSLEYRQAAEPAPDVTLVKAIARAHRWQRMLEDGRFGTMTELARAEKISPTYVSRILKLTLLPPDVVENLVH